MKNSNEVLEINEEVQMLFDKIRLMTDVYLNEICKGKATPYICDLKDTKDGREEIHQFVLNCAFNYDDFSIGEALMEMERTLNPNMIND